MVGWLHCRRCYWVEGLMKLPEKGQVDGVKHSVKGLSPRWCWLRGREKGTSSDRVRKMQCWVEGVQSMGVTWQRGAGGIGECG